MQVAESRPPQPPPQPLPPSAQEPGSLCFVQGAAQHQQTPPALSPRVVVKPWRTQGCPGVLRGTLLFLIHTEEPNSTWDAFYLS